MTAAETYKIHLNSKLSMFLIKERLRVRFIRAIVREVGTDRVAIRERIALINSKKGKDQLRYAFTFIKEHPRANVIQSHRDVCFWFSVCLRYEKYLNNS